MTADDYRAGLAEFLGTLLFVFLGSGAAVASISSGTEFPPERSLIIAMSHGLAIAAVTSAWITVSGAYFNPALTLAAWITGKVSLRRSALFIVLQLAGATAGCALLTYIVPEATALRLAAPALGSGLDSTRGLVLEMALTFGLVSVFFMSAMHPRGTVSLAPIAIGFTVLAGYLVGGPLTGPAMNPARSFGIAVVAGSWADHWIYWVGPLLGGMIAAIIANQIYLKSE